MSRSARGTLVLTVLFLGGGCLLGGMLASHAEAEADRTSSQVKTFGRILALVEDNSVGKVESKDMVENAIQGMLHTLDPHSNYLNREAYSEMKDEQRGSFHGLGIQITKRGPDKPLTILAPIDGTPASKAGLQPGDVISKIEGQDTIDLTVQEAVRKLKGEKGTKVTITIQRPGEDNAPFDISLVRDEIPTKSLAHSLMVQPGVGLIRISNFTSTTTAELDEAIDALGAKGMDRLILDLRSNPGGLLDQAVGVSSRFIPEGKLVVYTRGRIPGSDQDYTAKGNERTGVPLVVLVDHSSASASEIVSGAIQDHDRGLVVGMTTFGKGLVQRVIPLRDGGALALTTAKYYTPAGRLIQRDYTDLDDYFLDPELEEEDGAVPEKPISGREKHQTDSGRIVYGGGGITPDYIVPNEKEPLAISRMRRENQLFDFAVKYIAKHPSLKPDFVVDDAMMKSFQEFLTSRKFRLEEGAFEQSRKAIELRLRSQIAKLKWGVEAETRVLAEGDPQMQKALTLFEEAAKLAQAGENGRREKMKGAGAKPTDLKASTPAG